MRHWYQVTCSDLQRYKKEKLALGPTLRAVYMCIADEAKLILVFLLFYFRILYREIPGELIAVYHASGICRYGKSLLTGCSPRADGTISLFLAHYAVGLLTLQMLLF